MSTSDRQAAAQYLLEARAILREGGESAGEMAAEAVSWARCSWPESLAARRLEVRLAIDHGHADFADSLIAQGLLLRPADRSLRRAYAERLIARGSLADARNILDDLLKQQPNHAATLRLAARVAERLGQHIRRVELLQEVLFLRPGDVAVLHEMIDAYLQAELLDDAERLIAMCNPPVPSLEARWLVAKGRLHDAASQLERVYASGSLDEAGTIVLIDLLEELGDSVRLRAVLDAVTPAQPSALLRASRARLLLGDFDRVQRDLARIFATSANRQEAASLLTAASWASGRFDAARTWLSRAREEGHGEPLVFAEIWRRTLWGRLRSTHTDPRQAGADPESSPLNRMLRSALDIFSEDAERQPHDEEARLLLEQTQSLLGVGSRAGTVAPAA